MQVTKAAVAVLNDHSIALNDIPVLGLGCSLLKNRDPKRQSGCEFYHLTGIDALCHCAKYEKNLRSR